MPKKNADNNQPDVNQFAEGGAPTNLAEASGPARTIPTFDESKPTDFYLARDRATIVLLKSKPGEQNLHKADWGVLVLANRPAAKNVAVLPQLEGSVYELTQHGKNSVSNQYRSEILALNTSNHQHNVALLQEAAPALVAHLIQNKEAVVTALREGPYGLGKIDKDVLQPMVPVFDRVAIGTREAFNGLQTPIYKELTKPEYKENGAAKEILAAAQECKAAFDKQRNTFDSYNALQQQINLVRNVLSGERRWVSLKPADQELLRINVEGKDHMLLGRPARDRHPQLTEVGRNWAMQLQGAPNRPGAFTSDATLMLKKSAENAKTNDALDVKAKEEASQHKAQIPAI
jgi:hypothetical protein